jgi:hypothetical protein
MISDLVDGGVAKSMLDASADDIADVVVLIPVVVAVADAVDAGRFWSMAYGDGSEC